MGEGGDAARPGIRIADSAVVNLAGATVWVVVLEAGEPMDREAIARVAEILSEEVSVAGMSRRPGVCEAALAYLYAIEDEVAGFTRIRDRNLRFLAALVGARQASEALERAGPARFLAVASHSRWTVEEGVRAVVGSPPEWVRARCTPEELERVTKSRLERV